MKQEDLVKTTKELSDTLSGAKNRDALDRYLQELPSERPWPDFKSYFLSLPEVKKIPLTDLIAKAGIDRTYGYQILNGTRKNPGPDKILRLCLAARLDLSETQRALELSGQKILYSRDTRDAILMFSINRKLGVLDANELLDHFGEPVLE